MSSYSKSLATITPPNSELVVVPEEVPVVNRDNPFHEGKYMALASLVSLPAVITACLVQASDPGADFLGFGEFPLLTAVVISTAVVVCHPENAIWSLQHRIQKTFGFKPTRSAVRTLRKLQRKAHKSTNTSYTRENSSGLETIFDAIEKPDADTEIIVREYSVEVLYRPRESSASTWDKALETTIELFSISPKINEKRKS